MGGDRGLVGGGMTRSDADLAARSVYEDELVGRVGRESFLELVVDNASNGILAIDTESTIIFANPAIEAIFGYEPDELVGESLTVVIPESHRDRHLEAIERYLETGERSLDWDRIELPGLHRDGHEVPLSITFREVTRNGQTLFVGIISDITVERRAENERRLLYSMTRAVAEAEHLEDGLVAAIQQVCNLTDWEYGEAWVQSPEGASLVRTVASRDEAEAFEGFRQAAETIEFQPGDGLPGRVWANSRSEWIADVTDLPEDEFERTEAAASTGVRTAFAVPIERDGGVEAVLLFCMQQRRERDEPLVETLETVGSELGQLVARRRAEKRLEQEREVLQRVLETSPVGIYSVDQDGEVVQMNSRAETLIGVTRADLDGLPLTSAAVECFDSEGAVIPVENQPVQRVRRSESAVENFECQLDTVDGQRRWISMNAAPISDNGPDPSRIVVTLSDITEIKTYEQELERQRAALHTELEEVLSRISDAMFALDSDWRFTYVNDHAKEILHRPEEEDLLGVSIWEAFSEAVDTRFQAEYERAMESQEPVSFEEYYEPLDTWFEVNAYPSSTGLSVYFKDISNRKRYEQALTTLHEVTERLVLATDTAETGGLAVDSARDVLNATSAILYVFDVDEGLLVPVASAGGSKETLEEVPAMRPGEGLAGRVFVDDEPLVFDDVRDSDDVYNPDTSVRSEILVPLGDHGVFVASSSEVDAFDDRAEELFDILASTTETALDRLEREQELRDRERELRASNEQLKRLARINDLIRQFHRVFVESSTRQEIDEKVCSRLMESDHIVFAWIGDIAPDSDTVTPRAWTGAHQDYLDLAFAADAGFPDEPAHRTAETGEMTVVESVADDIRRESWRQEGLTRGFQSVISVPLQYDEFSYGSLNVYASDKGYFDESVSEVFGELGRGIANAINAVETKQGLLFDRVVQVEVRFDDTEDVLHQIAADVEGTLEFEGLIPQSDSSLVYFTADRDAAQSVEDAVADTLAFRHLRLIDGEGDRCLFEGAVDDSLVASLIADTGAHPRSLATDGTEMVAVIDLPHPIDVRGFMERLRTDTPHAELIARRELERSVETRQGFRAELERRLTDRQYEVLRTAYLAGFFDTPRGSTGEEIGQALHISQPTVNAHLRAAQRQIFSLLLEDEPTDSS